METNIFDETPYYDEDEDDNISEVDSDEEELSSIMQVDTQDEYKPPILKITTAKYVG